VSVTSPAHPGGTDHHRLFVYGSCVARDTFELLPETRFSLARYVARQSLVSAYAPVPDAGERLDTDATFGERMVAEDRASSLLPLLAQEADRVAGVIWDLTDERLGVYRVGDGYVTRSVDLIASGHDATLAAQHRLVEFGTQEHLALWVDALERFVADLRTLELLDRTLLFAVPWAERTTSGARTGRSLTFDAETANALFAPYYDAARTHGVAVHALPVAAVRADPQHRWGEAPFHYDEGTYRTLGRTIEARLAPVPVPVPDDLPDPQFTRRFGWDKIVDPWLDSMPVRADRIPSAYRIWLSAQRYLKAGNVERALLCEHLIKVLHNSYIPYDLELGEDVEFGYGGMGVIVHKLAEIERGVTIGSNVTIGGAQRPSRYSERRARSLSVPRIEPYAYVATGAKVLGGVTIGAFAIVGANSVVTHDVAAGTVVTGAPARPTRRLDESSILRYRATFLTLRGLSDTELVDLFRRETAASAVPSTPE
jgi:serine O-acetyltransferase